MSDGDHELADARGKFVQVVADGRKCNDVERVEEIFDRLVEQDVLDDVRTRREVQLEARGRSIASDAMADQE